MYKFPTVLRNFLPSAHRNRESTIARRATPTGIRQRKPCWLSLAKAASLLIAYTPASAAFVTGTFGDEVWSHDPTATGIAGGHTATASAYNYSTEQFELPVQAGNWNYDGNPAATSGTLLHSGSSTTPGKYWSYADITQAVFTADSQYWNIRISVAGDYEWAGDQGSSESPVGLRGQYYAYFGQFGTGNHYAFNISSGTGLDTAFSTTGVKLFEDSTDAGKTPPYGTAITTTFDDDINEDNYSGYLTEISTSALTAQTHYSAGSVYDIEFRYDYATGPIAQSLLENLDYLYVGVAESNPSAASALFANDHFTENSGTSAEYDTILIIPEPSTGVLALLGLLCLTGRRRR